MGPELYKVGGELDHEYNRVLKFVSHPESTLDPLKYPRVHAVTARVSITYCRRRLDLCDQQRLEFAYCRLQLRLTLALQALARGRASSAPPRA